MKKAIKWVLISLGAFLGIGLLIGAIGLIFNGPSKSLASNAPKKDSVHANNDSITTAPATGPTDTPSSWTYSDEGDKMTSKKNYYATVDANEALDLKPPYDGPNTASVTVRYKGGNNVYLSVTKGQFLANAVDGQPIKVRFDSAKAETYDCQAANDGSSNVIFISSASKFIAHLKKAKKLLIEAEMYDNGTQEMEFNIDGLKWDH